MMVLNGMREASRAYGIEKVKMRAITRIMSADRGVRDVEWAV